MSISSNTVVFGTKTVSELSSAIAAPPEYSPVVSPTRSPPFVGRHMIFSFVELLPGRWNACEGVLHIHISSSAGCCVQSTRHMWSLYWCRRAVLDLHWHNCSPTQVLFSLQTSFVVSGSPSSHGVPAGVSIGMQAQPSQISRPSHWTPFPKVRQSSVVSQMHTSAPGTQTPSMQRSPTLFGSPSLQG